MTELAEGSKNSRSDHHSSIHSCALVKKIVYTHCGIKSIKNGTMQVAFMLIGTCNIVTVISALLLNLHIFETTSTGASCIAQFGDQALFLAAASALALTTPWNFATLEAKNWKKLKGNQYGIQTQNLIGIAVPLSLMLVYSTLIVLCLNGIEFLNNGVCPNINGRRGVYTCLVWLSLFCFLHTTFVCFLLRGGWVS